MKRSAVKDGTVLDQCMYARLSPSAQKGTGSSKRAAASLGPCIGHVGQGAV